MTIRSKYSHLNIFIFKVVAIDEAAAFGGVPVQVDIESNAALMREDLSQFRISKVWRTSAGLTLQRAGFIFIFRALVSQVLCGQNF
jgi:hypothetical protein